MARFVSIDGSTNSFAFAVWENDQLLNYGKIHFYGEDSLAKACDASVKVYELMCMLDVETVVIESAIFANSANVAIALGISQGIFIGACKLAGVHKVYSIAPITWQSYIGNRNLNTAEKLQIRKDHPGKTASWYKTYERNLRKQRTIAFVQKTYNVDIDDNDVCDAIGLGHHAHSTMFGLRLKPKVKPKTIKRSRKVTRKLQKNSISQNRG